jgi:tetratricopeptide (TPR) repeat protein
MQKINNKPLVLAFTVLILILLLSSCTDDANLNNDHIDKNLLSDRDISLNNQGVGEMGSFSYDKAVNTFEKLVLENKDWKLAQQNLAIALLNRQEEGDENRALSIAKELIQQNPKNFIAQYIVGILKFNQGICEEALPQFENIIKHEQTDAYALYFTAQCYLQMEQVDKSLQLYQKSIKADSYLRSAYYGGFMAAQRLDKIELAEEMLNAYQKLASNPKARLAEIKYTRMGDKAKAKAYSIPNNSFQDQNSLSPPYFKAPKALNFNGIDTIQNYGMVNLNQTENNQIYIISNNQMHVFDNVLQSPTELDFYHIRLNEGDHQLAWGDINNDNMIDVYITGEVDQLYLQSKNGMQEVNMQEFGLNALSSSAVRMTDADHDGDLDLLLLSKSGQFELWNNNLNNTFSALSKKIALPPLTGYRQIFVQDVDSDRDADVILISDKNFTILLNDRMWDYEVVYSIDYQSQIKSVSFSDNDTNGMPELNLLFADKKILAFEYDSLLKYYKNTNQIDAINADYILQADVNGNGLNEYLSAMPEGIKILDSNGKLVEQILISNIKSFKLLNTVIGPEILALQNNQLIYAAGSKNRDPFLLLNVSGKEDGANSVRSNFSGIGTSFILRNQKFYSIGDSFQNMTGKDQDYQGVILAAGSKSTVDYVEMEWSDGVYQTELGLASQKYHLIPETQRQLSSCPVIFAWNNGQYEFISDVLGVGGIGFAIGRHEYGIPRPWENYLLTASQLEADSGLFKIQFTEPMEESAYLDTMQIQAIDVPNHLSVTLDERMQISEPVVTGKPVYYQSVINPVKVIDSAGTNVTDEILATDKIAIDIINQDKRFLGLVDEQKITLEFVEELHGDYHLVMNGWVEYGYSQTMFAAWQAGIQAQAPSIEYKIDGKWKVLLKEFGYPAGMPRAASVPISIPEKTRFLRIRTNMEIYFDQLGLIQSEVAEVIKYPLKLKGAQLKQLGFPKRQDNQQRVPSYDFSNIQPFWDTRYMEGAYSQLGDVTPLIENQDNALAIIGAGESIELSFIDDLPETKPGYKRYYLMTFIGWAKDMDILTFGGETLNPIPKNGAVTKKATLLNRKYNTRFKAGK